MLRFFYRNMIYKMNRQIFFKYLYSNGNTKMNYSVMRKNVKIISSNIIVPKSVKKKFMPVYPKIKLTCSKPEPKKEEKELRVNKINLQMLSRNLYNQIFKMENINVSNNILIDDCLCDLKKHGINTNNVNYTEDVHLQLPPLKGKDLVEHFNIIGEEQSGPYRNLIETLMINVQPVPQNWILKSGWTRYAPDSEPETVSHPLEDAFVFDVEICMNAGKIPSLAAAVSNKAWYGWVSPAVLNEINRPLASYHYNLDDLIPLENTSKCTSKFDKPRVVIGHNVSFDRSRVKEQYYLEQSGTRFLDTMSLHICISGITSYQRAMLKSGNDNNEDEKWKLISSLNSLSEVHKLYCGSEIDKSTRDIFLEGTLSDIKNDFNNLMSYCARDVIATHNVLKVLFPMFLDRFPHPVTLAGMLELGMAYLPVNTNWIRYINDCEQTYEDLNTEARFLLARRADQACQLLHDEIYKEDLWMWDQDWSTQDIKLKKLISKKLKDVKIRNIIDNSNEVINKETYDIKTKLSDTVLNTTETDNFQEELNFLKLKFATLFDTNKLLPARKQHLPGYPAWYRKLCSKPNSHEDWIPGPHLISTSMQVTPKLLSLTWEGYPLHYIREKGWGFLVPHTNETYNKTIPMKKLLEKCPLASLKPNEGNVMVELIEIELEKNLNQKEWWRRKAKKKYKTESGYKGSGVWCNMNLEDCCWFMKLPHKNGVSHNVGNPLARDFLNKFSDNVLAGDSDSAEKVLTIARMVSYWRNNRDRIIQQMVVWLKQSEIPKHLRLENYQYGVILPQVVVCGTLTRRAMEPTWMTASNAHKERIGSELRSMIQAPPGFSIVGADVDSQELWIASVLGDANHAKMHGATPLGWMTLIGTKSNETDMHSITAKAVGISRDHAKIINYARIYGAGQNFAERLLKQFNPSMPEQEAKSKAAKMFAITKGKRMFRLKREYTDDFVDKSYSMYHAFEISKVCGKPIDEIFLKSKWIGGSESAMFNRLEEIAGNINPVTPFLEGRLSRALEPGNMPDDRFLPTRINWVVQSGAVDYLHLMLVTMRWLMKDKIRFCLSFHDEIRYLVPEKLKYDTALAMHITNLLTRSFCSLKLGINDLPMSVAFFSSVEVDSVLRKESHIDCKTPSNPHGLDKGYRIKNGESLSIHDCIQKTEGEISLWKKSKNLKISVNCTKN